VSDPEALEERLAKLKEAGKRVRLDPNTASWWFARQLGGPKRIVRGQDPCLVPKARKNEAEIKGARAAHKRDGVAFARFLAWLDREAPAASSMKFPSPASWRNSAPKRRR